MCRSGPDCVAYQQCIMDLADVFFKPMAGERERLLRTSTQPTLTRHFFKRNARFVCPAPHAQLRDFYDWYLFWSSYPLPTDETQSFFLANSDALFKKECKYVQHGQTSDLPGLDYYALIGTTRGGRDKYRCLRSNSPVEGWHCHLRRSSDSCARHASPCVMHSKLLAPAWRQTTKAMVKVELLPSIGHYELHLRDRLCDAVRGTPLASMRLLQGWQRVDQSKSPTVPRGIVEGLFDRSFIDEESRRSGPAEQPHSALAAGDWCQSQFGHAVPSPLINRVDLLAALPHAGAMYTAGRAGDTRAVLAATGVLAAPGTIAAFPHVLNARMNLNTNLLHGRHAQLQSQLTAPAVSWQASSASIFAADTTTVLGSSAPLPAAMASGGVGGFGTVEVEMGGGDDLGDGGQETPVVEVAGSTRKEKNTARHKRRRGDPAVRAEQNRKRKWSDFKKYGGSFEYGEWKSAGEPTRP